MAATVSHVSQLAVPRPWDEIRRPQSQPEPNYRRSGRADEKSPNRVKSRPANPAVINSILDSFDALTPSPILAADEPFFHTEGRHMRPYTADDRFSIASSLTPSVTPGFGMEYGTGLSMNDESGLSNAALSPTVRTLRDPSDVLNYKVVRTPSFLSGSGDGLARSSSLNSRRSFSLRRKNRDPAKYKLSSESWVKQGATNHDDVPQNAWMTEHDQSSIHVTTPQESPRLPKSRIALIPTPSMSSTMSRAEQIIALTSTPRSASSKRRLYLTDTTSNESQVLDPAAVIAEALEPDDEDPPLPMPTPPPIDIVDSIDSAVQGNLEEYVKMEEEQNIPTRRSPQKTVIVDSIPMRTSSLRQSSSSPGPSQKKDRKSKRKSEIGRLAKIKIGSQRDSFVSSSSKEISDSNWNDLGEDDETVKRIRELREQRHARMLEPKTSLVRDVSPAVESEASTTSTTRRGSSTVDDVKLSPVLRPERPEGTRSVTEPSPLSRRVRRPGSEFSIPEMNGGHVDGQTTSSNSPDAKRRANLSLDISKLEKRPLTAKSTASLDPPLQLDYSYVDAVDVLHGVQRGVRSRSEMSPVTPSTPVRSTPALPTKSPSPKSVGGTTTRSKVFRWMVPAQHPDLPLDMDKKLRRRSANAEIELGHAPVQPDPLEVAVNDYLRAKRLNRKIKHPLTGRVISFSEVGDPNGAAVLVCLGMGLTRYVSAFYDELAATLRLRLVTIDRPGVGSSEPYPTNDKSGPLSWPDDVLAVCQHLNITKFSMLAHSAGAIYALATALILPHLIRGKLQLLSPWIPPSQLEAFSHPAASISPGALPRAQRLLRVLPVPFLKAANASFMTATSSSIKPGSKKNKLERRPSLTPTSRSRDRPATGDGRASGAVENPRNSMMLMDQFMPEINPTDTFPIPGNDDRPVLNGSSIKSSPIPASEPPPTAHSAFAATSIDPDRRQDYITLLTQRTWDLATRDSNPATDLLVCLERNRDIGFRYTDVHHQVVITHGAEDKRVPVANVRWLAEQMNRHSLAFGRSGVGGSLVEGGCEMRVLEGEGHGLMASSVVVGDVLTEIAGYWARMGG